MATTLTKIGEKVQIKRGAAENYNLPVTSTLWPSPWDEKMIIIDPSGALVFGNKGLVIDWTEITGIVAASRDAMITALATDYFNSEEGEKLDELDSSIDAITTKLGDGTQKTQIVDSAGNQANGVAVGAIDVTPNDSADLANYGWIEPRTAAGNIKFDDVLGVTHTWAFDAKELSRVKVKRVYFTDTTATGIVCYFERPVA